MTDTPPSYGETPNVHEHQPDVPLDELPPHLLPPGAHSMIEAGREWVGVVGHYEKRHADQEDHIAELEQQLEQAGRNDLTKLEGLGKFTTNLEADVAEAERTGGKIGLAIMDLEQLHFINEVYGHRGGDRVLKVVAAWLQAHSRDSAEDRPGDKVFHFGGDEFAIILSDFKLEDKEELAARAIQDEEDLQKVIREEMDAMDVNHGRSSGQVHAGATIVLGVSRPKETAADFKDRVDEQLADRKNKKAREITEYNRRTPAGTIGQQGFITMIVVLLLLILAAIFMVFLRVTNAN